MTESGMTHVASLPGLVEVRPASTLSHTALTAAGCRVVLFAFDKGEELTEHTAAVPVLLQVLSGQLMVSTDGQEVELAPGGLIHLTARTPHSVIATEPTILQLTMLEPRINA